MTTTVLPCNLIVVRCCTKVVEYQQRPRSFLGFRRGISYELAARKRKSSSGKSSKGFMVLAVTEGSAKSSSKSEESIPSWARPDSDEPPPWARDEATKGNASQQSFELPFYAYLLASAIIAIAAIGSVFEYVNQKPVFGVLNSDSIFYAPLLGFFAITGIPSSAYLWFKSVQVANREAEEQDKRDGYK